jgi:hypothetical protein
VHDSGLALPPPRGSGPMFLNEEWAPAWADEAEG